MALTTEQLVYTWELLKRYEAEVERAIKRDGRVVFYPLIDAIKSEIDRAKQEEILLLRAISIYGIDSQFRMLQEECCELAHAVSKFMRNSSKPGDLETEIADVLIMISQVRLILEMREGQQGDVVQEAVSHKLSRLAKRMDEKQ